MFPTSQEKITNVQASIAVMMTVIGVGIITLPRTSAEATKTPDVWISVAFSGLIAIVASYFVVKLAGKYPGKTIFEFTPEIVGKPIGVVINSFVILHFTLIAAYEARSMGEVIRSYLLDKTPIEVVIIVFMSVGVYLVTGGMNAILKLFELYFPVILFFFLLMFTLTITSFELDNVRPFLGQGMKPVFNGGKVTTLSYVGFEVMFVVTAFMQTPKKAVKTTFIAISFIMILYTTLLVLIIGSLTVDEVRLLTFPTMEFVKSIEVEGFFLERFEAFFMIMWVITTFTTYAIYHYLASYGLSTMLKQNFSQLSFVLLPVIYLLAIYPENINELFSFGDIIGQLSYIIIGVLPILLFIIAFLRKKMNKTNKGTQ
ncbi:GerAB/ArcD/ProY family transporter [Bacillus kexueae]|uniref:GerAB/ArcD/ProY family transporter n=1 Tax=Aeribacillus kexueae TaxID=2078952 RepID=UPI001FB03B35|nr:endospore germination permease [Bacillus kexueae]